jgi:hypothetical protein
MKPMSFPIPGRPRRRQRGQSMIEYVVICAVLVAALFVPIPGTQTTASQLLANSVRGLYGSLTFFLSLP